MARRLTGTTTAHRTCTAAASIGCDPAIGAHGQRCAARLDTGLRPGRGWAAPGAGGRGRAPRRSRRVPRRSHEPWYLFAAGVLRPLMNAAASRDWRGAERLPREGGIVVVPNHISH